MAESQGPTDEDAFDEDLEALLGAPIGFERVQVIRASLADVRPLVARGAIELRFLVHNLDIAALSPMIEASGRMLEVAVAKKVWAPAAYVDEDGDWQDPIGSPG